MRIAEFPSTQANVGITNYIIKEKKKTKIKSKTKESVKQLAFKM